MKRSIPAVGAALLLSLASFGVAGSASAASSGANAPGPFTSQGCASATVYCGPAGNGQGKSPHEAGSVGNADDKNPPGQVKKFADNPDYGYECDGNNGVGQGNPAHSGCLVVTPR